MSTKKEQLKDKVVTLVKDFIKTEGGISQEDLQCLFGSTLYTHSEVATALSKTPLAFNDHISPLLREGRIGS